MNADIENEDRILSDFLRSLGPWRDHLIVGGGYALIIFKFFLTAQKGGNPPVGTRDIDTLLQRKVPQASHKDIATHLKEAGFKQVSKDFDDPANEAYVKEINGAEIEIEFLTDDAARKNKSKSVFIAGVVAQPLSYLKLSLNNSIEFKTLSGESGWVVTPAAWIFHKGLTFPKRTDRIKVYKDLYGIWYAATQLGELSEQAISELTYLAQQASPKWHQTLKNNLTEWAENATPADWLKLEAQDPYGKLRKANFERLVKTLTLAN